MANIDNSTENLKEPQPDWLTVKEQYKKVCDTQDYYHNIWRLVHRTLEAERRKINPDARFPAEWTEAEVKLKNDFCVDAFANKMKSYDAERERLYDQLETMTPPTVGELLEKVEILSLNDHAGYGLEVVVRDLKAMGVN